MVVATWDLPVEFEYATRRRRRILQTPSSVGMVQRHSEWAQSGALREFELVWKNAPDSIIARLRQLWSLSKGGADTLTYTPVDDSTPITVRFAGDGLRVVRRGAMFYEARVTLVEERL